MGAYNPESVLAGMAAGAIALYLSSRQTPKPAADLKEPAQDEWLEGPAAPPAPAAAADPTGPTAVDTADGLTLVAGAHRRTYCVFTAEWSKGSAKRAATLAAAAADDAGAAVVTAEVGDEFGDDDDDAGDDSGVAASWGAREPGAVAEFAGLHFAGLDLPEAAEPAPRVETACFAGGCFWGLELMFQRAAGVLATTPVYVAPALLLLLLRPSAAAAALTNPPRPHYYYHSATTTNQPTSPLSRYTQGTATAPTYVNVKAGGTGHAEGVYVAYDATRTSYEALLELFWRRIDPTQVNRQGGDKGTQYRTGLYPNSPEQQKMAEASKAAQAKLLKPWQKVATEVCGASDVWVAEQWHQRYLSNGGRKGAAQTAAKGCADKIRCYG